MAAGSRAQVLHAACHAPQIAGTHDGNDAERKTGAELVPHRLPASLAEGTQEKLMTRQVQDAYIVAATRSPIGKAPKGAFRNTRPDDLLVAVLRSALAQVPNLDPKAIED